MLIKTPLVALGAVVALACTLPHFAGLDAVAAATYSSSSLSSSVPPPDQPNEPKEPKDPGNGPDLPDVPKDEKIEKMAEVCNAALASLAKIPEKLVVAFANQGGVSVVPVCNHGVGREAQIDASQALPLQNAIANNPALLTSLQARGFGADDVVGVVLIDGVATLYVHKQA